MLEDDYPEGRSIREKDIESYTGNHYSDILLNMQTRKVKLEKLSETLEGDYREKTEVRLRSDGKDLTMDSYLDSLHLSEASDEFEIIDAETVIYRSEDEKELGKIEYHPRRKRHIMTDPEHLYVEISL